MSIAIQPTLFDYISAYTDAERRADRRLCHDYLKQWVGYFKLHGLAADITLEEFEAAAARLAERTLLSYPLRYMRALTILKQWSIKSQAKGSTGRSRTWV